MGGFWGNARGCTAACRRELAELRREVIEERRQARYYRRMHGKAVEREQRLKSELRAARAKLKELRQRLRERWARRRGSEKRTRSAGTEAAAAAPRRRGQQRGAPGHGRRQHGHLPVQVEAHDVEPERRRCPACGDEYRAHGSEDSEQLEIEVRAYRRVIKRRRYRRSCQCAAAPALLTAAAPPRLIPKGILGISVADQREAQLWREYVDRYHYLGYTPLPGAQMRYLVTSQRRVLAVVGFGASAWKAAPRDRFIGWSVAQREARLQLVVNNARFLILPWVQVRNLASTVLARSSRRLPDDWQARYGYRPLLLETFVQSDRFAGTSCRAANWTHVGQTQGRGKLDVHRTHALPRKDIWLYPLRRDFRRRLCTPLDPHPNQ